MGIRGARRHGRQQAPYGLFLGRRDQAQWPSDGQLRRLRQSLGREADSGSFKPNAFGLYDMHGNVWQVVEDCWSERNYEGAPTDGSVWATEKCDMHFLRGGSWDNDPRYLRAASRGWAPTDGRRSGVE